MYTVSSPDYTFRLKFCPGCKRARSEKNFNGGVLCKICRLRKVKL